MIRIPLDLSGHCIQTEIRRLYNQLLSVCLKSPDPDVMTETKLEMLKKALESFDFPILRTGYRELAGGFEVDVFLAADAAGRLYLLINDRIIYL